MNQLADNALRKKKDEALKENKNIYDKMFMLTLKKRFRLWNVQARKISLREFRINIMQSNWVQGYTKTMRLQQQTLNYSN